MTRKRNGRQWATFAEFDAIRLHLNLSVGEFCDYLGIARDMHWRIWERGSVSRATYLRAQSLQRTNKPKEGPPPPEFHYTKREDLYEAALVAEKTIALGEIDLDFSNVPKAGKALRK